MKSKFQKQIGTKLTFIVIAFMYASIVSAQHAAPWNVPKTAVNMKNPYSADASSLERGKHSYQVDCVRCHGKEGKGDGYKAGKVHKQIADLGSEVVQKEADGQLFWKISEARRPMPLTDLTNDQRWDIINYIRTFRDRS